MGIFAKKGALIDFLVDHEFYATQQVRDGVLTLPEEPSKEGFEFLGWQIDGKPLDAGKPPRRDATADAVFRPLPTETEQDPAEAEEKKNLGKILGDVLENVADKVKTSLNAALGSILPPDVFGNYGSASPDPSATESEATAADIFAADGQWEVVLTAIGGDKSAVIRLLGKLKGWSAAEASGFTDFLPATVGIFYDRTAADSCVRELQAAGAHARAERCD